MKHIRQFLIILLFTCIGEVLHTFIPLPIPASIYGLVLLFIALNLGIFKVDEVHDTADFLIEIMPVMFIPAAVGIIESWAQLQRIILPVSIITVITTVMVMVVSGKVTQFILEREEDHESTSH